MPKFQIVFSDKNEFLQHIIRKKNNTFIANKQYIQKDWNIAFFIYLDILLNKDIWFLNLDRQNLVNASGKSIFK